MSNTIIIKYKEPTVSMKAKFLIAFLKKEGCYRQYLTNMKQQYGEITPKTSIANSFVWSQTNEGATFWSREDLRWTRCWANFTRFTTRI